MFTPLFTPISESWFRKQACLSLENSGISSYVIGMADSTEQKRQKILDKIKNFRLFDDDYMTKFFEDDLESTSLVLQIIMENPTIRAIKAISQRNIKNLQGRSVRLDIQAEDETKRLYDIEIQRAENGAGARRARYNSAIMDANVPDAGKYGEKLPESYVIFITETDVFGRNRPLYHVERVITEDSISFNDGAHIIYVNGENKDDTAIGKLMHDFSCKNPDDMKYKILAERARYLKQNQKGVSNMCKAMEELIEEEKIEMIENLLKLNRLTVEEIAKVSNIPLEKVKELALQLQPQMA